MSLVFKKIESGDKKHRNILQFFLSPGVGLPVKCGRIPAVPTEKILTFRKSHAIIP